MIKVYIHILLLLTAFVCDSICSAQPYSANNVLAFTRIASVVAPPNGQQVAFVTWSRSKSSQDNWQYTLNLESKNGNIIKITHADTIASVSWSPDGKSIAYIAEVGNQNTLSVYQLANKKILPIVTLKRSIDALKWSPSGKQIAFVADEEIKNKSTDGILTNVADDIVNSQLYIIIDIHSHTSIKPITSKYYSISGSLFGGGFDWSPNGRDIAFSYQPSAKAIDGSKSKVAILNLRTLRFTPVSFCNVHTCSSPIYSPDGHWLAFAANIFANGKAKILLEDIGTQNKICLMDKNNETHCLQNTFNKTPYLLGWNANSQAVYVGDLYKTEGMKLYELNQNTNIPVKLVSTQKNFIEPLTLSINNTNTTFSFGAESVNKAPEVFTATADNFKTTQITHINNKFNKPLGQEHLLHWLSTDNTKIEGLLITPNNYNPKHQYPLYVDVHGGPAGAQRKRYLGGCDEYSDSFPPTTCPANILSLGYIILQVNYRGSNDYGINFRVKNFRDFGGGDYQDIMSGIDTLVHQGIVDTHKIAIAGWSNGGYLTAWAISHSNRFYTAIDGDGLTDFISYTGTSDDTDFFLRYLGAYYWNDDSYHLYWESSPIAHVKNIRTPLLILQGEKDVRVPLSQSQELYTALNTLNKPVKMLVASKQSHVPNDPDTISKEINAIDKWLKNGLLPQKPSA